MDRAGGSGGPGEGGGGGERSGGGEGGSASFGWQRLDRGSYFYRVEGEIGGCSIVSFL